LEETLTSVGLPCKPPQKEDRSKKQLYDAKAGSFSDQGSFLADSPHGKLPLTKIQEEEYEEDWEGDDNDNVNDPAIAKRKENEMKVEHYRQFIQRSRLNAEIIRKSYDAPQVLDLIGGNPFSFVFLILKECFLRLVVVGNETEKSVQDLLQQSELLLTSINESLLQEKPEETDDEENRISEMEDAAEKAASRGNDFLASRVLLRSFSTKPSTSSTSDRPESDASSRPETTTPHQPRQLEEIKLLRLELMIKGDLYHVSFSFLPDSSELYALLRYYIHQ
jgi:hypothetical protein